MENEDLEEKLQKAVIALIEQIPKNEEISIEINFKINLTQKPKTDKK